MRPIDRALFVPYDVSRYELARLVAEEAFAGVPSLGRLHEHARELLGARASPRAFTTNDNLALRARLTALKRPSPLYDAYDALVAEVVAPRFGGRLSYSLHPTFRVQLAGTESVSNWHTDVEITGREDQVNAWVPLVDAHEQNTIWVESDYGRGDYAPIPVTYGEVLLFDGGWLRHGSVSNTTGTTRVSIDFRFASKRTDLPQPTLGILGGRPAEPPPAIAERLARG